MPEVVFCQGKTVEQVVGICASLAKGAGTFLATRADGAQRAALTERFPPAEANELARTVFLPPEPRPEPTGRGEILVVTRNPDATWFLGQRSSNPPGLEDAA